MPCLGGTSFLLRRRWRRKVSPPRSLGKSLRPREVSICWGEEREKTEAAAQAGERLLGRPAAGSSGPETPNQFTMENRSPAAASPSKRECLGFSLFGFVCALSLFGRTTGRPPAPRASLPMRRAKRREAGPKQRKNSPRPGPAPSFRSAAPKVANFLELCQSCEASEIRRAPTDAGIFGYEAKYRIASALSRSTRSSTCRFRLEVGLAPVLALTVSVSLLELVVPHRSCARPPCHPAPLYTNPKSQRHHPLSTPPRPPPPNPQPKKDETLRPGGGICSFRARFSQSRSRAAMPRRRRPCRAQPRKAALLEEPHTV